MRKKSVWYISWIMCTYLLVVGVTRPADKAEAGHSIPVLQVLVTLSQAARETLKQGRENIIVYK